MSYPYDPDLDAFELYHKELEEQSNRSILGGPALPALGHAVSGAAGSAISTVITYPLSLLVTRLQVQRQIRKLQKADGASQEYKGLVDAAQKIYEEEGIAGLYSGCAQDAAKTVVDSFLFFLAYNFIRQSRLERHGTKRLPIHEELGVGMVAGALARLFTSPVQQIVTRKQTAAMVSARSSISGKRKQNVGDIARQIYEEKGILGFWSGYSATLILTLNPALTFMFHETLLRMFVKREQRAKPGSRTTFLIAALSKAIASSITYPFALAKSRAQVSSKAPTTDLEKGSQEPVSTQAKQKAKQSTIFNVLVNIVREEGFLALYAGLEGEVFKGFFAHGLTMLLKERIHKIVVQTYYMILKLLKKYPGPEELAKSATQTVTETASDVGTKAREIAADVGTKATEAASNVGEKAKEAANTVTETASSVGTKAKEAAITATETASSVGEKAKQAAQELTAQGKETVDKAVDTFGDLYQSGKENTMDIFDEYLDTGEDD